MPGRIGEDGEILVASPAVTMDPVPMSERCDKWTEAVGTMFQWPLQSLLTSPIPCLLDKIGKLNCLNPERPLIQFLLQSGENNNASQLSVSQVFKSTSYMYCHLPSWQSWKAGVASISPHLTEEEAETLEHKEWVAEAERPCPLDSWSPQLLLLCFWTWGTVCSAIEDIKAECDLFVECIRWLIMCNFVMLSKFWKMMFLGKETMKMFVLLLFKLP